MLLDHCRITQKWLRIYPRHIRNGVGQVSLGSRIHGIPKIAVWKVRASTDCSEAGCRQYYPKTGNPPCDIWVFPGSLDNCVRTLRVIYRDTWPQPCCAHSSAHSATCSLRLLTWSMPFTHRYKMIRQIAMCACRIRFMVTVTKTPRIMYQATVAESPRFSMQTV